MQRFGEEKLKLGFGSICYSNVTEVSANMNNVVCDTLDW